MPDDGITLRLDLDASGLGQALRAAPRKAARLSRRFLLYHARRAVFEARAELTRIKTGKDFGGESDPGAKPKGTTAQSITNTRVYLRGREMAVNIMWGVPHGKWLEWGPTKREWIIRAKHAKALRFAWPMAPQGGFTATRVGKGAVTLTANVFYYKHVKHRWDRSMLRPHVGPAMQKITPEFIRDMESIPRLVLG